MLRSRVIEHIRDDPRTESFHLLYFYVDYEKKQEKPYHTMIATFLQQAQGNSNRYDSDEPLSGKNEEELSTELYRDRKNVYIVIDAVDQLPQGDRFALLDYLNALSHKHLNENNGCRLAVIISSRTRDGCNQLQGKTLFEVQVKHSDNGSDIEQYLEVALRSNLFSETTELKKQVLSSIADKSNGMLEVSLSPPNALQWY